MATIAEAKVAVDAVIFTIHDDQLKVLLFTREKEPFQGKLELPGGLLLKKETANESLQRKLNGIIDTKALTQFHTFTNPDRDPRGRVISIGFFAFIEQM